MARKTNTEVSAAASARLKTPTTGQAGEAIAASPQNTQGSEDSLKPQGDQAQEPVSAPANDPAQVEGAVASSTTTDTPALEGGQGSVGGDASSVPPAPETLPADAEIPEPATAASFFADPVATVVVQGPKKGRWRIKRHFGPEPTTIPLDELTEAEVEALRSDPALHVTMAFAPH